MEILTKAETLEAIAQATTPLREEINLLRHFIKPEMNHTEASQFLEVSDDTLRTLRDKPGTLIRYRKEGAKPIYETASLIDYRKSKYLPPIAA